MKRREFTVDFVTGMITAVLSAAKSTATCSLVCAKMGKAASAWFLFSDTAMKRRPD
jgi:hypothetical protein